MLFVGDDWAEDHHDVELQDPAGRRLARARLAEGVVGIARLHELVAAQLGADDGPEQVVVAIETDRGPWVQALVAAGYQVFPVNPRQVARYRERHGTSGAKSDTGDAHTLADMVRTDRHQLRAAAGDSDLAEAIKLLARAYQRLIWDRHRHLLRLRAALVEFFPAALAAFPDLAAADALELLQAAPDPASAARRFRTRIAAALKRASRRGVPAKANQVQQALRAEQRPQPERVVAAYAATVPAAVAVIGTLNAQIEALAGQVEAHLAGTRTLRSTVASRAGRCAGCWGVRRRPRPLPRRPGSPQLRRQLPGDQAVRQEEGRRGPVRAQRPPRRPAPPAGLCALTASPGARAYSDQLRARGTGHHAALRQLSNRLVGILHGCLKTHTRYSEATAWSHRASTAAA